jgi:hypothetical protein
MAYHSSQVISEVLELKRDGLSYRRVAMRVNMTVNQVLGICYREHLRISREMGSAEALSQTGMDVQDRDTRPSLPYIPGLRDTAKYKLNKGMS